MTRAADGMTWTCSDNPSVATSTTDARTSRHGVEALPHVLPPDDTWITYILDNYAHAVLPFGLCFASWENPGVADARTGAGNVGGSSLFDAALLLHRTPTLAHGPESPLAPPASDPIEEPSVHSSRTSSGSGSTVGDPSSSFMTLGAAAAQ